MIQVTDKTQCCGCQSCSNICPKNSISMISDDEGFIYPKVDITTCINCNMCEKVCPFKKDSPTRERKPDAFGVKIKNDEVRMQSSSGGIFSILAESILEHNGVVYGVAMTDDLKGAHHIRVDRKEELRLLRGSKYLQSTIGNIYINVKNDLSNGKNVLFSGVPCQINGLKLFLGREYENLLTVEVICHGTPSPLLWKKYYEYLEDDLQTEIRSVNFRNKNHGWKSFEFKVEGDGVLQSIYHRNNPYMLMFLRNYSLRPSCYSCMVKDLESMADFTIADFWGIQNIDAELDDDKGTSLVLIQTEKARKLFEKLSNNYICKKVSFEMSIAYNTPYYKSCPRPVERDNFFNDVNSMSFDELKDKYCKTTNVGMVKRFFRLLKRAIHRVIQYFVKV